MMDQEKLEESIFYILLYIEEIMRQFREVYGITDNIPDGEYPMTINGKLDPVRVKDGWINWKNLS